jgi:hypothetical protein
MDSAGTCDVCATHPSGSQSKSQSALKPIDRRLGSEVEALIGELRHELFRRQACVPDTTEHAEDLRLFHCRERVARSSMRTAAAIVAARPGPPALDGARG